METWWPLLAGQRAAEPRENQAWVLGWFPQAGTLPARQSTQLQIRKLENKTFSPQILLPRLAMIKLAKGETHFLPPKTS